jgi:microcin C transport system substrate-binding protein
LYKKLNQKNHEMAFSGYGAQPPYPRYWDDYHSSNAFKTGANGKKEVVPDTNNITMTADPELDALIDKHRKAETEEEVQRYSWQLEEMIAARGNTIPAWEASFYRYLCWRWLRWPKTGNARSSQEPLDAHMYWIDEDIKRETKEAMREGRSYGEVLRIFDDFRQK